MLLVQHDAMYYTMTLINFYHNIIMQWAYGVTCWEVFSGGRIPYAAIKPSSILGLIQQGDRLEMPDNSACSDDM